VAPLIVLRKQLFISCEKLGLHPVVWDENAAVITSYTKILITPCHSIWQPQFSAFPGRVVSRGPGCKGWSLMKSTSS
jgi:hypothetical protein